MKLRALFVAAVSASLVAPLNVPVVASAAEATIADVSGFKALADTAVQIDADSVRENDGMISVDVAAVDGVTELTLSMRSSGAVDVDTASIAVAVGPVDVSGVEPAGAGTLTAVLAGRDARGEIVSSTDTVWIDAVADHVVVSDIGTQDLEIRVAATSGDLGLVSEAQAEAGAELAKVGDPVDVDIAYAAICPAGSVCVSGTAEWTDSVGGTHPVRQAEVDIVDSNSGSDVVIATTTTDDTGAYAAVVTASGGTRDISVRLLAANPGFKIVYDSDPGAGTTYETQMMVSTVTNNVPGGTTLDVPFVANNVADNQTSFSLHNAMLIAREYLPTVQPAPFADVDVVFPSFGSFYDGNRLNMLQLDRWDWDVMLHEYGHFIADELNIEQNPGGAHSSAENLGDRLPKDTANRLAWGEGWPTYFAVGLLQDMNAAALGIPNIGDTRYQDTEDISINTDLEDDLTLGEDNEATVMAVLWDLYDTVDDGLDDIELGAQTIWDTLDAGDPHTLSDVYALFAPSGGAAHDGVNCVFSQMNVAPRLVGAASTPITSATPSPTIQWSRGNGGNNGENDSFVVEYRNAANTVTLHTSGPITSTSYTAPAAAWSAAIAGASGTVNVTVTGTETRSPVTGPYRSCAHKFVGGPPSSPSLVTSIAPKRFADTRSTGETLDGQFEAAGKRPAGSTYTVSFAGRGDVPATARAVVMNVTAVQADDVGFVTAFDCALPRPLVSSLNYTSGVNLGNEVIVTLNGDGDACFYNSTSIHLGVDVVGFVDATSPYSPVEPARLLETRTGGQTTIDGLSQGGGRTFAGGQIPVTIAGRANVPTGAVAAIVNVTAIGADDIGFVTVHACVADLPFASSLNYVPATNRGNELVAPLDMDGDLCLFTSTAVHLTVDVVGYVPSGSNLQGLVPARFLDTRPGRDTVDGVSAGEGQRGAGTQYTLQITGRNGVPAGVDAVVVNITAIRPEGTGFVTVHPCEPTLPVASSLNHVDSVNGGNEIIAKLDATGRLCLYTSNPAHLTVDLTGYLAS